MRQYAILRAAYTAFPRDLVEAGFASRIMFGSDGSARRVREGIGVLDSMPFLNAEQQRSWLGGAASAFYAYLSMLPSLDSSVTSMSPITQAFDFASLHTATHRLQSRSSNYLRQKELAVRKRYRLQLFAGFAH